MHLAHAIIKAHEMGQKDAVSFQRTLDPLVKEFEVKMLTNSRQKAEKSLRIGRMMFQEDGAKAFSDFFIAAIGQASV